jgi:hypothetical protein
VSRWLAVAAAIFLMTGCGSAPPPAPSQASSEAPSASTTLPKDETIRFPATDRVETHVVANHMLNKPFLPGGTMAHYKKGKTEYDLFVTQCPSATDAAIALANLEGSLQGAKLIPTFGGYFGTDAGRPAFIFPKDTWIAGVIGLPEKEADPIARTLAARLN